MNLRYEKILGCGVSCSPDARFLLEVIAADPASQDGLAVKPLAKWLHLDEKVVLSAFSELVELGVFERLVGARLGRGGRAPISYRLLPGKRGALADEPYLRHGELLRAIFSGADLAFPVLRLKPVNGASSTASKRGARQPPGGRGRLSLRNRVLFAVLLSRADQFGEVQLGLPELSQLSGMQIEQVKNRLHRLMTLGLIRRHISGLSSKVFATGRVHSTYFLNVDAVRAQGAIAVHIASDSDAKADDHAHTLWLAIDEHLAGGRSRNANKMSASILEFFSSAGRSRRPFFYLQHLLYRYASWLVSSHWKDLAEGKVVNDLVLRELIAKDFFREPVPDRLGELATETSGEVSGKSPDARLARRGGIDFGEVCERIYSWALEIAHECRTRFGQVSEVDFSAAQIRILPVSDDLGYKALTILYQPVPEGVGRFAVFEASARGALKRLPARNDTELALQNRMDFGLVTLPRKVRRARAQ